ncbi:uncharacterized protein LOC129775910 isoform X3 [Toxorhynchites rutilus septentrionalis]|uniref:uncharacterized protein LOC129775910 isoform X3 n=1 Tax=Toxorhynchites rutilus septentrionalis TaxID=329112 RepID=UPI002479D018|nr:uncharacterized protein LOC129775910 isoform X3 [Toxorhynchites rutilus septentrionalis]
MQQSTATMTTTAGQGGAAITSTTHQMQSGTTCCMMPPPVLFLFFTLLMTSSATAMLCAAIMTDHWEHVSWNREQLDKLGNKSSIDLQWYLDGRAAKFSVSDMHRKTGDARNKAFDLPRHNSIKNNNAPFDERANVFLVPMNGGIWTLCVDLTAEEIRSLSIDGFPQVNQCVNYLAGNTDSAQTNEENNARAEWQHSEFQPSLHPHLSRNAKLIDIMLTGVSHNFGQCRTSRSFWSLSTTNQCRISYRRNVSVGCTVCAVHIDDNTFQAPARTTHSRYYGLWRLNRRRGRYQAGFHVRTTPAGCSSYRYRLES